MRGSNVVIALMFHGIYSYALSANLNETFGSLEEVFPKVQQKNFRVTSRRETRSVPVSSFRSPNAGPQYFYGVGNVVTAEQGGKTELRVGFQGKLEAVKPLGNETYRKTPSGQTMLYSNIAKVLATSEDEGSREPKLTRSASLAKVQADSLGLEAPLSQSVVNLHVR